jgi:Zn-dependent M28 family amino/carboxypeptidase
LKAFSSGPNAALPGDASFTQPFTDGVNVLGLIGAELPNQYVIVGAHYDHVGSSCESSVDPADTICNGATDNATGVAAALENGHHLEAGAHERVDGEQHDVRVDGDAGPRQRDGADAQRKDPSPDE